MTGVNCRSGVWTQGREFGHCALKRQITTKALTCGYTLSTLVWASRDLSKRATSLIVRLVVSQFSSGVVPVMSVVVVESKVLSVEAKREHVLAYVSTQYGFKGEYLRTHGITKRQMTAWRGAVADGDLARGLFPRQTGRMTDRDVAEIRRLEKEVARLQGEVDKSRRDAQRSARTVDALGKAIDAMHKRGVNSAEDE